MADNLSANSDWLLGDDNKISSGDVQREFDKQTR
jgi:hypothetical protein